VRQNDDTIKWRNLLRQKHQFRYFAMVIYKITNTINGKVYIGKTKNQVQRRWQNHVRLAKNGSTVALHLAIRKYGATNFSFEEIISVLNENDLDYFEIHFIKEFNSCLLNGGHGYNMTFGGDGLSAGFKHSQTTKDKMSSSRLGKKKSQAHKDALSAAKTGEGNAMYGVTGPQHPCYGKTASKETKALQSKAAMGRKVTHRIRKCPHCGLEGSGGAMSRYHFDKCRIKIL